MTDRETLAVYARAARKYADGFAKPDDAFHEEDLAAFAALLPPGGHVHDLGCGPGMWAARLQALGFKVSASDAAPEMAAIARSDYGLDVKVAPFEALTPKARYDGIWANFSLLHARRAALPAHLARIHRALKPGGIFHIGMKLGTGENRDRLGRFYTYYGQEELSGLLEAAGFSIIRTRTGSAKGLAGTDDTFVIMAAHG